MRGRKAGATARRRRSIIGGFCLVALVSAAMPLPSPAAEPTLVTLEVPSRCIDPTSVVMAKPPPGKPSRPPALRVNVLLPDGYDGERRFPVLYLLQGAASAYDYWLDDSDGELIAAVRDLPAIVVMPEAGVIATYANSWSDGARTPCWEHYYLDELIPAIESAFRILPGRRWHAIGGFSSGGLGAVNYAAKKPGYFGQILSFSGVLSIQRPESESSDALAIAVFGLYSPSTILEVGLTPWRDSFGHPRNQEFYWAAHNPPVLAEALRQTRIYVAHGTPTRPTCVDPLRPQYRCAGPEVVGGVIENFANRDWAEDFMTAARASGADVTYHPLDGGHWYSFSARFLADAIQNWGLFEPVPETSTEWVYKTASQDGEMWDIHFAFVDPPGVLETFTRSGGVLRGEGVGSVQITTAAGCSFDAILPFEANVAAC